MRLGCNQLTVFLKAARPGAVKTRLAAAIGETAACVAYRQLVEIVLHQLAEVPQVELRFAPDDAWEEITPWLRPGWRAQPQGAGDLGEKMNRAFTEQFAAGAQRVAIIGSDCPHVTPADIHSAWLALERHDVVLGPAADGGYWLVALKQPRPRLFDGMAWSTDNVLNETLARATALDMRVQLLRELEDVDDEAGWKNFLRRKGTE